MWGQPPPAVQPSKARLFGRPEAKGTSLPLPPYPQSERITRPYHAHVPPLVHSLRALLAPGIAGAGCLPTRVAAASALPHRRSRCARRSGNHLPRHHAAVPPAGRTVSDLTVDVACNVFG